MSSSNVPGLFNRLRNPTIARVGLLAFASLITLALIIFPIALRPSSYPLQVGNVAQQDILAPYSFTYDSEVLTDLARKDAGNNIPRVYLPADPAIARQQIEKLRSTLLYIDSVRADTYAKDDQKLSDLLKIQDVQLSQQSALAILKQNEPRWLEIKRETVTDLEQVLRSTIQEADLYSARGSLPSVVELSFSQDQASIVVSLVSPLIIPNSLFSEELTNAAILEARNKIQPISSSYIAGEIIIRRGQVLTTSSLEALQKFNLIQPQNSLKSIGAAIAIVLLSSFFLGFYFSRRKNPPMNDFKSLALITVSFLIFFAGARYIIPNRTILPYLYPIAAFGLTLTSLYSMEIGLVFSLILSILSAYGLSNSLDLTLFYTMTSLISILVLGKGRRISSFFWAFISIGLAGTAAIFAYRLPDSITDWLGIATLVGASIFNGLASASLTLLLQYLFAQLIGITTPFQLLEISRPDHPLLQALLRNAPGTYQHSLLVSNLAEQAAEETGADPLLTRIGAIYHDVGKSKNPSFFIENQIPGELNPHDDLDPLLSANTIIQHVIDGIQLAKKYRLPPQIKDFIQEHHGTLITRYQYVRALEGVDNRPELINKDLFRYPGPAPRSKETAILMLADMCEARARAEIPKNEEELRSIVKKVIDLCQKEGQLDNTNLTLRDLNKIQQSFVNTMKNTYHPRIKYPEIKPAPEPTGDSD